MSGRLFHRRATAVLSCVIVVLGAVQIATGPARGIGSVGYVLGALLMGIGLARLWLLRARR
jgi:hypothetical protein